MVSSKKSMAVVSGFLLTAMTLTSGCAREEPPVSTSSSYAADKQAPADVPTSFQDAAGETVQLTHNADGTDTATYADGRSVTFRRDDDGNLSATSGTASLLTGIAAGYLLSQGFSGGAGHYDTATRSYRVTRPYTYQAPQKPEAKRSNAVSAEGGATASRQAASVRSAGGFGGAGARSAAS